MNKSIDNKRILVTGGTGSFGKKFIQYVIKNFSPKQIIIFSRDEIKQWEMENELKNKKLKFIIGDVRDKERLIYALKDVDILIHAAATKIVPTAEYNPIECVKTNIIGAYNIIESSIFCKIKKVIALSTDKASNPVNLYGATKLVSDKLFIAANNDKNGSTKFSVVRYGNVAGSRGSIIPFFQSLNKKKFLPITDKKMTRFLIKFKDAIELVNHAILDMVGGEIYVKKIPSVKITDLALAINKNAKFKIIGIRPGEKLHEQMISSEDSSYTYEYQNYYKILPSINNWHKDRKRIKSGKKVKTGFSYTSDNNDHWLNIEEIKKWIKSL
tara:strand:+ start:1083 stop:2063 length:981 start_codon:yes stop_codon:yes gene_type:complete